MFPSTFISILDVQSWWEVPSIAHFCSLFRNAFDLLDFDIEDLEEALLTDGTEEPSWLQELIVRLLSGCLPHNEISTFNYQMFLRRLFRQKCQDQYNPFNTDIDFQLLPLRTKVDILHALCDFRLDSEDVSDLLKNLEAESLRVEPLGHDSNKSAYWYFYGTRLYREDFAPLAKKKSSLNQSKSVWQVICFTQADWFQLDRKLRESSNKRDRQLHRTLSENFLPELPRLFQEKEKLARKRALESRPRRTSSRLNKDDGEVRIDEDVRTSEDHRHENMASGRKNKRQSRRQQGTSAAVRAGTLSPVSSSASGGATPVGRQTNNSLAAATGQIVIQAAHATVRKKLKTSQVFRQTDEDLITGMHKILDYVKNHEDAWPFADPVEEDYAPNYYTVIRKPMDLQRMEDRLDAGYYKNFGKFRDDFQLIVDNCRLYNGAENEYTEMVDNLLKVFERATGKFLDQITSSDDEVAVEFPPDDSTLSNSAVSSKKVTRSDDGNVSKKKKPTLSAKTKKKRHQSLSDLDGQDEEEEEVEAVTSEGEDSKVTSISKTKDKKKNNSKGLVKDGNKSNKDNSSKRKESSDRKSNNINDTKKSNDNKKSEDKNKKSNNDNKKSDDKKKSNDNNKKSSGGSGSNKSVKKNSSSSSVETVATKKMKSSKNHRKRDRSSSPPASDDDSESADESSAPPPVKRKKISASVAKVVPEETREKKTATARHKHTPKPNKDPPKKPKPTAHHDAPKTKKPRSRSPPPTPRIIATPSPPPPPPPPPSSSSSSSSPAKPLFKDKHNKLRETIEKLKAKSSIGGDIARKGDGENVVTSFDEADDSSETHKENNKVAKNKRNSHNNNVGRRGNGDEENRDDRRKKKKKNKTHVEDIGDKGGDKKTNAAIEALSIVTEQTLKDINKWLDDTPKDGSEFSSLSNSPSAPPTLDELGAGDHHGNHNNNNNNNNNNNVAKRTNQKKDKRSRRVGVDLKFHHQLFKRREIQRTIDRLQPGKSKGNLISTIKPSDPAGTNPKDELLSLLPASKKDPNKNSLIVKTDDNAPKLSLGTVLDSFGKHRFDDGTVKKSDTDSGGDTVIVEAAVTEKSKSPEPAKVAAQSDSAAEPKKKEEVKSDTPPTTTSSMMSSATPNLSAWFKAFGAPKVPKKDNASKDDDPPPSAAPKTDATNTGNNAAAPKVPPPEHSPLVEPSAARPRERRISTGSSVSERSSFSQDMDSPRVGMDERMGGAYPAPYPSPMHRSPSGGASPLTPMTASPPKTSPYPPFNGQIRVGFYQDTVSSNKSSPDKSCGNSPNNNNPNSPYGNSVQSPLNGGGGGGGGEQHVYTQSQQGYPAYPPPNSPYYYGSATPPAYPQQPQPEATGYYDTNKSLTDQYQAKNYSGTDQPRPPLLEQSPKQHLPPPNKTIATPSSNTFPVKKRAYNEDSVITSGSGQNQTTPTQPQHHHQQHQQQPIKYVHQNIPNPAIDYTQPYTNNTAPAPPTDYPPAAPGESSDMSKYTNMGYSGPDLFNNRAAAAAANQTTGAPPPPSQYNLIGQYSSAASQQPSGQQAPSPQQQQYGYPHHAHFGQHNLHHNHHMMQMLSGSAASPNVIQAHSNYHHHGNGAAGAATIANLSHIVDRYGGSQPTTTNSGSGSVSDGQQYYASSVGGGSGSNLTNAGKGSIFSQHLQQYNHAHQGGYGEMATPTQAPPQRLPEKKPRKRKTAAKNVQPEQPTTAAPPQQQPPQQPPQQQQQGFQSYSGLKSAPPITTPPHHLSHHHHHLEPGAISLKTVPGSAFNFAPPLTTGLYGDNLNHPAANFLDDFRSAAHPNYYTMAAAAAAHRSTASDVATSTAASPSSVATATPPAEKGGRAYQAFMGAGQRGAYPPPLGGFMSSLDNSQIYQHYLQQAGVLNSQGLLGPPGAYPPGYHPLSMRQPPYESMTRPPWL